MWLVSRIKPAAVGAVGILTICSLLIFTVRSAFSWRVESVSNMTGRTVVASLEKRPQTKVIALTFDDGPDPRFTPSILAILAAKGVKATFFVVGKMAEENKRLVLEEHLSGHEIANHTYSHPQMRDERWTDTVSEITKAQDVLMEITGEKPRYFRPPRGEFDADDIEAAKAMGYRIVMWTVGIENKGMATSDMMVERVVSKVRNGSVILLHDGLMDRSMTVAALPKLIDSLEERGYEFVTVSDLLRATGEIGQEDTEIVELRHRKPLPTN